MVKEEEMKEREGEGLGRTSGEGKQRQDKR